MRLAAAVVRLGALAAFAGFAGLGACKGKEAPPRPATSPGSAAAVAEDAVPAPDPWEICKAALVAAPKTPTTRRAAIIIDACQPCGTWSPLLQWGTLPRDGGPDRRVIEQALKGCDAWCEPNAKIRFMGVLDDARAKGTRAPWRELGEICKEAVSAVPDARYMSAPYFALDRIARDVAKRPDGAKLLEAIVIPLPAVSASGAGMELPESPLTKPTEPPAQVTVSMTEIRVGTLPRATLGASGLTVTSAGEPYPGHLVTPKQLAAALAKLGGPVAVFAPHGLPAARVAEVAAAAGSHTLHLAVVATGPIGWSMHGTVPIALGGKPVKGGIELTLDESPDAAIAAAKAASREVLKASPVTIRLAKTATVRGLAKVLGALAFFEVSAVALVAPKA